MKKERLTPEQIRSNISDPYFLDEEGKLIPTASHGKSKKIGDIKSAVHQHGLGVRQLKRLSQLGNQNWI